MKKQGWLALLVAVPLMVGASGQADSAADPEAAQIKALAEKLVQARAERAEKVAAVHQYVRDEIAQAKTQYG